MSWTLRCASVVLVLALTLAVGAPRAGAQWFTGNLADPANRADYVIITSADLAPAVAPLAAMRSSRNSYVVMTVLVDSITAQFHRATADSAIRDFIVTMVDQWQLPRPRFCLLAGAVGHVPSHKAPSPFYPSYNEDSVLIDQWFVTRAGATMPYPAPIMALGRMPAWTPDDMQAMVNKTIAYEQATAGSWARRAIALADSADRGFMEREAVGYQNALAPGWPDTVTVHLRPDSPLHRPAAGFRELWGEGCAFVSFIGLQNWQRFSSGYFTAADVDSLKTGTGLPVCLFLGGQRIDHPDTISMAVALLRAHDRGAVCVVAPAGLMYFTFASEFSESMYGYLVSHRTDPIGLAWQAALSSRWTEIDTRWNLLGDPALVVKRGDLSAADDRPPIAPSGFALLQNYPNPFNPSTMIRYAVPSSSFVTVRVYNTLGEEVATLVDGMQGAGVHEVRFDGAALATGVYLCRMQSGSFVEARKLLLVR
ncbi:MAG: T9SS type A sorting domain-containing protein [Ignavibacteriae bacterium]|nr:T9SS type A sorting domain-containing protein [Ignavibacteriota bacterium]